MRKDTMGESTAGFAKAKEVNSGRMEDATSRVRSMMNSAMSSTMGKMSRMNKAAKGGCSSC